MMVRTMSAVIATIFAASGLASCSSSQPTQESSSTQPARTSDDASADNLDASCSASNEWSLYPSNIPADRIADRLKVSETAVRSGYYGPAVCSSAISLRAMDKNYIPLVSVDGHGARCAVIGSQVNPSTHDATTQIVAACPQTAAGT